mmetsp:Transcript_17170/g.53118  ORF Transcript_17170/g.53118 Transcript_17170/m.53118 type:complete len:213 (-) Transcript_17170:51-689(-)
MAPFAVATRAALLNRLSSYAAVCLLLGNGPRRGYADASGAALAAGAALEPLLRRRVAHQGSNACAGGGVLLVFGGDTAVPGRPDLGMVAQLLRERYGDAGLELLAVQSWEEVDDHVDLVFRHDPDVTYGGVREQRGSPGGPGAHGDEAPAKLVGASAVYLAHDFVMACQGGALHVICVGTGGRVGSAEMRYADTVLRLPVTRVPARDAHGEL